jgi:DNA polymerase III epsilon subunit-like protein
MLPRAPRFPVVWPIIAAILRHYRRVLVYNADFDHRLLNATASRYGLRVPGVEWVCLMEQYAIYHGAWSAYHHSYTWKSLAVACANLGVDVPGASHRATADALSALGVLRALAALDRQIALYPVPERKSAHDAPGDDHPF